MEEVLIAILSMLLMVALIPLYLWRRRQDSRSSRDDAEEEEDAAQPREAVVRATGRSRMRRRPAAGASTSSAPPPAFEEDDEENEEDEEEEEAVAGGYRARATKKGRRRQEREAMRQAEEAARESRRTKQDHYAEMRRRKDEEYEAKERMLEEEAKVRKAREEEAAALEFEKWKGAFSIEEEGIDENEDQEGNQGLLSDFVDYIKKHKCIPLEDLAAEFRLRTQECISRINSLESMGRLSGVMDDRGKYIYISLEEMQAVADYIKRHGRVSISHLASKSNQFIDLEPKSQLLEEISIPDEIAVT